MKPSPRLYDPSEGGRLISRPIARSDWHLPVELSRRIKLIGYVSSEKILIRFRNNRALIIPVWEWEENRVLCAARIALAMPGE